MKRLQNFLMQASSKITLLLLFATSAFILGHILYKGWDFSVYVLNAQYLFGEGTYFEISRPPLMIFFLGVFSFFGWRAAEYIYIIFSSLLFFLSSLTLARSLRLQVFPFFLFSINAFVLLFALREGTELLALALLEFALAFLIQNKNYAGFFLGLVCLTRYPFVVFFPLLLFHKSWKTRLLSALGFVIAFIPWFWYNKVHYGNIFYSIADSYALNVLYRDYVPHAFHWSSFLFAGNILLPLFFWGIFLVLYKQKFSREKAILFSLFLLIFYSVYSVKADVLRYYIPFTIPFVFFSVSALEFFSQKSKKILLVSFIFLTLLFTLFGFLSYPSQDFSYIPEGIHMIDGCALESNIWVPLNYYGRVSEANPPAYAFNSSLENGNYILLYYDAREPAYMFNQSFLSGHPIVMQTEEYILLGKGCLSLSSVDASYLEKLNLLLLENYNYTVSEDPCEILFYGNGICTTVNQIFAIGS